MRLASPFLGAVRTPLFNYNVERAALIRRYVDIPVIVVGGMRTLADIREIVEGRGIDCVSLSRPFIIEPDIVARFQKGQSASRCINCGYCLMGVTAGTLRCYYGRLPRGVASSKQSWWNENLVAALFLPVVIARVGIRIQTGLANVTCTISAGNIGSVWMGLAFWRRLLLMGPYVRLQTNYQFFREAMFAFAKQGSFILLHDARNPAFLRSTDDGMAHGGLWPFLYEAIPQNLRHRVGRSTIQMVVEAIQESGGHEDWIGDFKKKYGLQ